MSDFDKEAEREKLRKKFERDREKRESTQRMSELLLQGATMTNRHCDTCGDPIFRHDGNEFCPTCERESGAGTNENGSAPEPNEAAAADAEATAPSADVDAADPAEAPADHPATGADETRTAADAGVGAVGGRDAGGTDASADPAPTPNSEPPVGDADLSAARASLVRTVNRYARAAEETDDPRRARSHLAAVREAAEALDALDR